MKKTFILVGHPDSESLTAHLALEYERGTKEAGYEIRRLNLGELSFDPILHKGYKEIQHLEPDLLKVQESIKWADHFVIFYPAWFSTMPALLKGMFDRIWLPHFAFHFRHNGLGWERLLKGRSATVFVFSDSHPLLARFIFGDSTNEIRRGILWFAGFSPIRIKKIGPVKEIAPKRVARLGRKFFRWGGKGL